RRYTSYLRSLRAKTREDEAGVKQTTEYQQLDEEAKASLDKVKGDVTDIDKRVGAIQAKLDAVTDPFQNQRGRIVVITWKLETAPNKFWHNWYDSQLKRKKAEKVTVEMPDESGKRAKQKMDFAQLEQIFNDLRDEKAKVL